jgi:hypothetical protein
MSKASKHLWRLCPVGQAWVRPHPRIGTKGVRGHCRHNPSGKDQIYLDEIIEISSKKFADLESKDLPSSHALGFAQGKKFDLIIAGWTKYWNEVLNIKDPLDPDLVKALIATESGFRTNLKVRAGKKAGYARGLMQVTDWTQAILEDEKGEIKDHYVNVPQNKMNDANGNIAAGIRWLFRKRETASAALKREATWEEAIAEYKSYLPRVRKGETPRPIKDLRDYYNKLKGKK